MMVTGQLEGNLMLHRMRSALGPLGLAPTVVFGVLVTWTYVAQGVLLSHAVVEIYQSHGIVHTFGWITAAALVAAFRCGLIVAAGIATQKVTRNVRQQLREKMLAKLFELGPGYTTRKKTGAIQSLVIAGVEALEIYFSTYLPSVAVASIGCFSILAYLMFVDWRSACLLGAFVVLLPIADHLWLRWRMPKSSGVFTALAEFGAYLLDSLQGVATLKAFSAVEARRTNLLGRAKHLRNESMDTLSVTLARSGLTNLFSLGGFAAVIIFVVHQYLAGRVDVLTVLTMLFVSREAFRPLHHLEKSQHAAWAASGAAVPIIDLLNEEPVVIEPSTSRELPKQFDVAFEKVTFCYSERTEPVLKSVSFSIPGRQSLAIVGASGSGKSTVFSLLLRFFDPQIGRITIGGVDIRTMTGDAVRDLISVVPQDPFLFHGTIEDNLRLGNPEATLSEMEAAARLAQLHTFIESLPNGYGTQIGERGTQLSGGQRQRIAIARALLKDAPILLLDEITSNVDRISERAIQQAISDISQDRTVLIIAHRLSTIESADSVVVLENGAIREKGLHRDLIEQGGVCSRLVQVLGEAV